MVNDVLLREVREAFSCLAAKHLIPFVKSHDSQEPGGPAPVVETARQLLLLQRRSEDVLSEFAGFYCVRLLLDEQSPLATYFIDLFSQLEWLLERLRAALPPQTVLAQNEIHVRFLPDETVLLPLLRLVRPVAATCRLLYVAYMILPTCKSSSGHQVRQKVWKDEVKIHGRQVREFSGNPVHCLMRELGRFTNLDQPGQSMLKLIEILGEGSSAIVHKGVFEVDEYNICAGLTSSTSTKRIVGQPVAVKMFPSDNNFGIRLSESMQQARPGNRQLRQELHRLVSVKHPNIVTPKGYIGKRAEAGDCGLVMELMDASLHDYLEAVNDGRLPPLQEFDMLGLMLEIARGMRFLHECSIIHRDLKPRNVLLRFSADDEDLVISEVKLADFGLTKLMDHFDNQGGSTLAAPSMLHTTMTGTSCYMAPEIRGNQTHQPLAHPEKVDVFSFGTTCFNILIGNPNALAFCGNSVHKFYDALRTGEWKQWMRDTDIDKHPHYLVKLIGKCWEPNPAMRPTFATLCLLLQHAMICHVSAQMQTQMHNAIATVQSFPLYIGTSFSFQHARLYSPIILNYLQEQKELVIGLRLLRECLVDFESVVAALEKDKTVCSCGGGGPCSPHYVVLSKYALLSGLICNEDGALEDFLEEVGKDSNTGLTDASPTPTLLTSSCQIMDSYLEKPDPLIYIKGLPCHILVESYCPNIYDKFLSTFDQYCNENNVSDITRRYQIDAYFKRLNFKLPDSYKDLWFDFASDDAHSELFVDTSLIPLLIAFWAKPEAIYNVVF